MRGKLPLEEPLGSIFWMELSSNFYMAWEIMYLGLILGVSGSLLLARL